MQEEEKGIFKTKQVKVNAKSWYQDKAFAITVQRNILFVISIILFASVILSLVVIKSIVEKQSVEPYVIKVSDQDQIPVAVNIDSVIQYTEANQGVVEYFLLQYITSRESYNFFTYLHDYKSLIKRMSTSTVFNAFWDEVNSQSTGVINTLGRSGTIDIAIRQLAIEQDKNIAIVRISKRTKKNGNIKSTENLRIKMHYYFDTKNLSYKDIVLNPLGFKVDLYEVTPEISLDNN